MTAKKDIDLKRCWFCGATRMENKGAYVQCQDCGATYNELSVLQPSIVQGDTRKLRDDFGHILPHRDSHVTKSTARRIAKQRAQSQGTNG